MMRRTVLLALLGFACKQNPGPSQNAKELLFAVKQCTFGVGHFCDRNLTVAYSKPHMDFELGMNNEYELMIDGEKRQGQMSPGYRDTIVSSLLKSGIFDGDGDQHHRGYHVVAVIDNVTHQRVSTEIDAQHDVAVTFRQVIDQFLKNSPEPLPKGYVGPEVNVMR